MINAYRSSIFHFHTDPACFKDEDISQAYTFIEDGILIIENEKVKALGDAHKLINDIDRSCLIDYSGHLIIPGMIDTHVHYPQTEIIASHGEQLLEWLNIYAFPAERQFSDRTHAAEIADFFLSELLRCGTTTALVFGTVHKQSVQTFFEASSQRNMRMICGKVMMDRNAPADLCDTPESGYQDSKELIDTWHEYGRQLYAVTPRFAITSSAAQLSTAGKLLQEYPTVYLQTHISENKDEVSSVRTLFPESKDYVDVYDQFGLLGKRSHFAHGIHLSSREHQRLHETGSSIVFCPTSNLFLGNGLLDLDQLDKANVSYSIATDVGGGTSLSMLQTLQDAYKISQLNGAPLCPFKSLYLATLGNAKALCLDDKIGSFKPGNEADFIVLDMNCTPLMKLKQSKAKTLKERLFSLIILGDDRSILATYIAGKLTHQK